MDLQTILESDIKLKWEGLDLIDAETGSCWVKGSKIRPGFITWNLLIPHKMTWERSLDWVDEETKTTKKMTDDEAKRVVQDFLAKLIQRERDGSDLFASNKPRPFQTKASAAAKVVPANG